MGVGVEGETKEKAEVLLCCCEWGVDTEKEEQGDEEDEERKKSQWRRYIWVSVSKIGKKTNVVFLGCVKGSGSRG